MSLCHPEAVEDIREQKGKEYLERHFIDLVAEVLPGFSRYVHLYEFATPRTIERFTMNKSWEPSTVGTNPIFAALDR